MSLKTPATIAEFAGAWKKYEWDNNTGTFDIGDLINGDPLRVSAFPHAPFIIEDAGAVIGKRITGPFVNSLAYICASLRYRCKVRMSDWGTSPNDSLNGVLGDLFFSKAEVGIAALTVNPSRSAMFDIIQSPFSREYQVVIHDVNTHFDRSTSVVVSLLKLFEPWVWVLIGAMFTLFLGLLTLMGHIRGVIYGRPIGVFHGISLWTLRLFGSGIGISDLQMPRWYTPLKAQTVIASVWLLWTVIIVNIFTSTLPAILSSGRLKILPFDSVEGLVNSDYEVHGTFNMKWIFGVDPRPSMKKLGEKLIPIRVSSDNYTTYVIGLLNSGQVAVVISNDNHFDLAEVSCSLVIAVPQLAPHPVAGFVFEKGSGLRRIFSHQYNLLRQTGIVTEDHANFVRLYHTKEIVKCLPRVLSSQPASYFSAVNVGDLQFILISVASGLTSALLVFALEFFFCYHNGKKRLLMHASS